jgi:hypothetical protein
VRLSRITPLAWAFAFLWLSMGCGQQAQHAVDGGASDVSAAPSPDAAVIAAASTPGNVPPCNACTGAACPARVPEAGAACISDPTLTCEYGDDPQSKCNTVARCVGDAGWQVLMPEVDGGDCPTTLSSACPPSLAAGVDAGGPCPQRSDLVVSLVCHYPDGLCACVPQLVDLSLVHRWTCSVPPSSGCPAAGPHYGESCPTTGEVCLYSDGCQSWLYPGHDVACCCGTWRVPACPRPHEVP